MGGGGNKIIQLSMLLLLTLSIFNFIHQYKNQHRPNGINHNQILQSSSSSSSMYMSMDDDMGMMDDDSSNNNNNDSDKFCVGMMSMTMAMSGFQWSLNKKGDCLTYFVGPWQLNLVVKFHGAMVYSFFLALLTEGVTVFSLWVRKQLPHDTKRRKILMSLLYGIQQWFGHVVMLISMMFSIELFACVLAGVMAGRILFADRKKQLERRQTMMPASRSNLPRPVSAVGMTAATGDSSRELMTPLLEDHQGESESPTSDSNPTTQTSLRRRRT